MSEQTITERMTRADSERFSEDSSMRMLRIFILRQDQRRFCITASILLPQCPREAILSLGWDNVVSQAREGTGIFQKMGRPTQQEQEYAVVIKNHLNQQGDRDDIVSVSAPIILMLGQEQGKELTDAEVEEAVLACIWLGHFKMALQVAEYLPALKRAQIYAILS